MVTAVLTANPPGVASRISQRASPVPSNARPAKASPRPVQLRSLRLSPRRSTGLPQSLSIGLPLRPLQDLHVPQRLRRVPQVLVHHPRAAVGLEDIQRDL